MTGITLKNRARRRRTGPWKPTFKGTEKEDAAGESALMAMVNFLYLLEVWDAVTHALTDLWNCLREWKHLCNDSSFKCKHHKLLQLVFILNVHLLSCESLLFYFSKLSLFMYCLICGIDSLLKPWLCANKIFPECAGSWTRQMMSWVRLPGREISWLMRMTIFKNSLPKSNKKTRYISYS